MASIYLLVVALVFSLLTLVACIPRATTPATEIPKDPKQLILGAQGKETSAPDFVRLLVMRVIYGIASTMGMEERLADVLNGAFVPPIEDESDFGFDFGGIETIFADR